MAAYLSSKVTLARVVLPLVSAGAALAVLCRLLAGPVLGGLYDLLMKARNNPPVAREILIIETGEDEAERVIPPSVAARVVMNLTEMSASSLIFLTPLLGGSGGGKSSESELLYVFEEEFKTINSNVKNLFDGIRLGSIAPEDAQGFVLETLRLTEQGKERLLQAAAQSEEANELRLEKAINVFDNVYFPQDAQVMLVNTPSSPRTAGGIRAQGYSRVAADPDGVVRRIAPFIRGEAAQEHVAWRALKNTRYGNKDLDPFLDSTGAILVEKPAEGTAFRLIPLKFFLDYEELDRTVYRLLAQEVSLAGHSGIVPERYPPFLYEKALKLQEELLDTDDDEVKKLWIELRSSYYVALGNFFSETTRRNIELSFQKLIDEEKLDDAGTAKLLELRDAELKKYTIAHEVYAELAAIRGTLEIALHSAFCILGNIGKDEGAALRPNPARAAALLANGILTEAVIRAVDIRDAAVRAFVPALFVIFIMLRLRVTASILMGALLSGGVFAGFCWSFVSSGVWVDPLLPALTTGTGALVSLLCARYARSRMARRVRLSFGALVSRETLRRLIAAKKPLPEENRTVTAAIVAVRSQTLAPPSTTEMPSVIAENLQKFRAEVKDALVRQGAVIIDCSGDMVLGAFASPLECLALEQAKQPPYRDMPNSWEGSAAQKAARLIAVLLPERAKRAPWSFGLDYGVCCFSWSPLAGYAAAGRAVERARLLARLCPRYKAKSLVTPEACAKIDPALIKSAAASKRRRAAGEYYEIAAP